MMTAQLLTRSSLDCPPRFATPRTDRATLGPKVAEIAAALGTPFMPWQQQVIDVALEVDDERRPVYRKVILTVPRQSGKTSLMLATFVHRALAWGRPQQMVYAAQTGVDARKKFVDEQIPLLQQSPFHSLFRPRLTSGHEAILWKNGSRHGIAASTEKTSHGPTLDLAVVDEAWAQPDGRLEQALSPTMITKPDAQMWFVSTAGSAESVYFRDKVNAGRAASERPNAGVAFFEWSAEDRADPEDPATWWGCMPAMGRTVTEDIIRGELNSMGMDDFRRAYLNQRVDGTFDPVIPYAAWELHADRQATITGSPSFALDVSPNRSMSALAVAGDAGGRPMVEIPAQAPGLVDYRSGTDWVVPRVADLAARYQVRNVYLTGTAAEALRPELERADLEVVALTGPQLAAACGVFFDAATATAGHGLVHAGQPELDTALGLAWQKETDHGWSWGRRKSAGDITPLVAATVALWAHLIGRNNYDPMESAW